MIGLKETVWFLHFVETITETVYVGGEAMEQVVTKEMWVVTTLGKHATANVIWEMIQKRWDIEN